LHQNTLIEETFSARVVLANFCCIPQFAKVFHLAKVPPIKISEDIIN